MGELYVHDLDNARERYLDLVKTRRLKPDDIHAIMLGGLSDAIQAHGHREYPDLSNPTPMLDADYERVRKCHEHEPDVLAAALLWGCLALLLTATVDPTSQRLPP